MYLFFDVEALGFPKKWKASHTDTFNWPRMVRMAWHIYDEDKKCINSQNYIIKPEGFEITYDSERIHRVSTDLAREEGVVLKEVLAKFAEAIKGQKYIIAHNLNFDEKVVGAEFIRKGINHNLFESERYCTMQESTYYCKIPGPDGRFKWPTIIELYYVLFQKKLENSYDPSVDAQACADCFFKLVEIEAIDVF